MTLPWPETREQLHIIFGELDWSANEKYKIKPATKRQAEIIIKELMTCILGLPDESRIDVIRTTIEQCQKLK